MPDYMRAYQGRNGGIRWTPEMEDRLRALWGMTMTASEIGREMGLSKDSVVGKAHRLSLPQRPSPIQRGPRHAAKISRAMRMGHSVVRLALNVGPPPLHCQFIAGEPTASDDCKCMAPVQPGSPYCPRHHSWCWSAAPKMKVAA